MEKCLERGVRKTAVNGGHFTAFFLFLRSSASCLENSPRGKMGGEMRKMLWCVLCRGTFSLAKLNDWLSVPFRMVSGSKNLNSGQPNNRQNATCNMQHVSHAAAPLNCISLPPNTSTISRLAYTKIKPEKKTRFYYMQQIGHQQPNNLLYWPASSFNYRHTHTHTLC